MTNWFLSELCNLKEKKIILASESPRRKTMLETVGLNFQVVPARVEEIYQDSDPVDYAIMNAWKKAELVSGKVPYDLIIAADTVVALDGKIYEKPIDRNDARRMLKELSGKTHRVITGFGLLTHSQELRDYDETRVSFYELSDAEIEVYLDSGEPFDKAGAYGVQGYASLFVQKVEGCYFNVVGFPLAKFYQRLKQIKF